MKFSSSVYLLLFIISSAHAQNYVTTYAGDGTNGYADGDTATCKFKSVFGICIDHSGNLYIADNSDHRIRKISVDGIVTTLAGTGVAGYLDGPGSIAKFNAPSDLCADDSGNIYVSDFENQYIRKISADGNVSTVAGNGIAGYADGNATAAEFNYPRGICIDAQRNLFIADSWNHRIRKIDVNGNVSTLAGYSDTIGVQSPGGYADGSDTTARFNVPCGMSIDSLGNLYLADAYNHRIRKISPSGFVTTVAGTGPTGASSGGFLDGDTSVARLNTPTEVFISKGGKIFIGDTYNNRIRLVSNGTVSTVAGNGIQGYVDGIGTDASFAHPRGLVLDAEESHVYVCDGNNHVIRKISLGISTGISPVETNNSIFVFPNPGSGKIFFNSNSSAESFCVRDVFGRKILENSLSCNHSHCCIDVSYLPDALYFISFFGNGEKIGSAKFMIVH